jgi:hypothetical protein
MPQAMENQPELSELIDARREVESLRQSSVKHDELVNVLYEAGRRIASEFDAPKTRAGWVVYQEYTALLEHVKADIETRLQAGRW